MMRKAHAELKAARSQRLTYARVQHAYALPPKPAFESAGLPPALLRAVMGTV